MEIHLHFYRYTHEIKTIKKKKIEHDLFHFKIMKLCILATLIRFSDLIYAAEITLQSIENLDDDELRTDEGNEFKLIQLSTGCKIKARFFLSYQNTLSSYIFQTSRIMP